MRGAMAKGIRRDIRRAVGEEALEGLTSATSAINHAILPNQNALHERVQALEQEADRTHVGSVRDMERQRVYVDALGDRLHRRVAWFEDLTWWGRLCWLVRGRP